MTENEKEINLNGKIYVLKEEVVKEKVHKVYQPYDTATENKIHKKLGKILTEQYEGFSEYLENQNPVAVMDPANVMMVIAKSDRAKAILARYIPFENKIKIPDLKFEILFRCQYSGEYLTKILNFLYETSPEEDYVKINIEAGNDYPLKMSTKDFEVILAPVVDPHTN